ncbi:MAG: D-lyxose/D-mannose family sugar isomerase [Spirochaetales bacterium]|nr:D-lyxose/D-mannose family sugar isomerase [Spirochaetales bacterium]
MKRSEINAIMRDARGFLEAHQFLLPPFAGWSPEEWARKGPECREIVEQQLGWDITDFGLGDYSAWGLLMFTIRNGTLEELKKEAGKVYAEKILIVKEGQITPTHFHYQKMEDIINRGGGELVIQFWNSTSEEGLADTEVSVSVDGARRTIEAGGTLSLGPGESVCIPQRLYHKFWGEEGKGTVLVGEVSRVNDDYVDNRFYDRVGRFAQIEEDEAPLHLLYDDYKNYYRPGG